MPIELKVPAVGESITEGTIARWLKKDGQAVREEEPVFELETEKASTEVAAPSSGVLRIRTPEGSTVKIGAVVAVIEEGAVPAAEAKKPAATPAKDGALAETKPSQDPAPVSPAARRLATEEKVPVQEVSATGRGGLVTKGDVVTFLEAKAAPAANLVPREQLIPVSTAVRETQKTGERETRQKMSAIRQRIADRLLASQKSTAALTTFNEADLTAVMALRTRYKEPFQKKHGVNLGFMGFFVKACVEALRAYPLVNARLDDGDIVFHHYCNIGVAVSTEKGLMVPVLHDVDQMSFGDVEKTIAHLAGKARDGKIGVSDLQGGTFTITNGGVFGSLLSTPILNPPQSAILGMHTIQKRAVVVDDQIVIRPMMYLALTYDHRLIDGREAVLFLVRVKECIENPERLLLEV